MRTRLPPPFGDITVTLPRSTLLTTATCPHGWDALHFLAPTAMTPGFGFVGRPHLANDEASADPVPRSPMFSSHLLTAAAHHRDNRANPISRGPNPT